MATTSTARLRGHKKSRGRVGAIAPNQRSRVAVKSPDPMQGYGQIQTAIVELLETVRRVVARSINAAMTATYWEIGRRIVQFEQGGAERVTYGEAVVERLAKDLTQLFGRAGGCMSV
jgi:hypothetical protein